MKGDPILSDELRAEIVSSFEHRLRAQGSSILDSVDARDQMLDQIRSVLDEVVDSYRAATENADLSTMSLSAETDARQGIEGMHPTESLHAANVLFETALPFVLRAFSAIGRPDAEAGVAVVLHRVIMSRIVSSAVSYTGSILKAIRDSHRAELARLARDLHDCTAHTIGVAIQNLELHEVYASRDLAQAQEKLHRAREAMRQALDGVRHFSAELRITVRPDGLERALTGYLAANAERNILTSVKVTGDTAMLPGQVCEEVYVTLREAIRNALVHSGTQRLDVTVEISESRLLAQVSDTGQGFSVEEATKAGEGIGLFSMRERVQLLGGTLRLSSRLGHGTTVEISIPLGKVLL
ncbi:MAG: sensor histidine kinase [Pseudonocardiaceae bacterium]